MFTLRFHLMGSTYVDVSRLFSDQKAALQYASEFLRVNLETSGAPKIMEGRAGEQEMSDQYGLVSATVFLATHVTHVTVFPSPPEPPMQLDAEQAERAKWYPKPPGIDPPDGTLLYRGPYGTDPPEEWPKRR